jgi:hypothetical protein
LRFPGHPVIPESEEKVETPLLVESPVFTNWISIFRYSLDTIGAFLGGAPALPLAMAQFFMAGRPDSDRA